MSIIRKITNSNILYKILIDIITILIFIIFIFFASNFVLNGILSSYVSVGTLFIILIFFIILTIAISNIQKINYIHTISTKQKVLSLLFVVPFLFLSLKSFPIYIIILLISTTIFLIYLIINLSSNIDKTT